ncbi:hypothetical protein HOM50_04665 [bacterium]|nr:hypothetical protein [bacterium]MBT5015672.1 hypothetical protein [bacterium]
MKKLLVIAFGLSLLGSQLQAFAIPACLSDSNLLAQLKEIKLNDVKEAVSALPGATKSLIAQHPRIAAATLATAGYLAWVKYRYNKEMVQFEKGHRWGNYNTHEGATLRVVIPVAIAGYAGLAYFSTKYQVEIAKTTKVFLTIAFSRCKLSPEAGMGILGGLGISALLSPVIKDLYL